MMKANCETKSQPRTTTFASVYNAAIEAFQHDKDKALKWYLSEQPEWGISPYQMCKNGKARAVLRMLNKIITQ